MTDLRITITVKNGVMLRAMEDAGFTSAAALARAARVTLSDMYDYLSLKKPPYRADGSPSASILAISDTLNCAIEGLFPAPFLHRALAKNRVTREVSSADLPALLNAADNADPERAAIVHEAANTLNDALGTLLPREALVLRRLYGLDGERAATMDEIGAEMGVTRERIRQISLKAQRKLARPSLHLRARAAGLLQ